VAKAPAGFTDFVETRAPSLTRTVSLLEMDDDAAEQALVSALGWSARRWRSISRDGNAESEVRQRLYGDVTSHWKRSGFLDAVPAASAVPDDASAGRHALASLTNRQRASIVLSAFESLNDGDVAALLRLKRDEVEPLTLDAAAQLRRAAGAPPDAPLLPLLNSAAVRDVPNDLTGRALAASRSGSRRGYAIAAGAVAAVSAVVAGALLVAPGSDGSAPASAVPANVDRWGIPAEPPGPRRLPSLAEQPIAKASMAYVTQGVPVVTDAATGEARTVLGGRPQPEWYDGNVDGVVTGLLRRGPPWTQAVLSPDGQWLLLVQAPRDARGARATGELYLVRVATGEVVPLPDADPVARSQGVVSIADSAIAWAPGGGAFACVCDGRLRGFDLDKATPMARAMWTTAAKYTDVAWGREGLIGRRLSGAWVSETQGGTTLGDLGAAEAVAVSIAAPARYLSVGVTSIYALGADTDPDGGRCVLWDADFTTPVEVQPVPDRDGPLCTPVSLQPGRSGVLLVLRPDRPRPQPLPLDVVAVDAEGASTVIGTLPPGTTFGSFAAGLVG
jgi:DNA-directed RNA polymerase specialized sigma24 family protein